jgi:hypothetical protein
MRFLGIFRLVLACSAATAMLADCGGSHMQIGKFVPAQNAIASARPDRGGSWMAQHATSQDLLYVANLYSGVTVYTYPQGKLVGNLTGFNQPNGLCVDRAGDVFVANASGETIVEYAHGGKSPIETLSDNGIPNGCAIDPKTGDLAVTNICDGPVGSCFPSGTVLIFRNAKGRPETRTDSNSPEMFYCAYDKRGNLFTDGLGRGLVFAELPKGSKTFTNISLVLPKSTGAPGGLQWAEKYTHLAVTAADGNAIYEYTVNGDYATLVHKTPLKGLSNGNGTNQFWIFGRTVVAPVPNTARYHNGVVEYFNYPAGGKPTKLITRGLDQPWAAAVSPANT